MSDKPNIPFLDLVSLHAELKDELMSAVSAALDTGGFIGGAAVQGFEEEFASFCGAKHCVGVANGTDALRFAMMAAGIGAGDAVITVPNTFIATAEAISQTGARPLFVDIDEATYNLDPAKLEAYLEQQCDTDPAIGQRIDRKTKLRVAAVVPVHLYGQMADMERIEDIAAKYGLKIVEDACQAHGAEYFSRSDKRWKRAGTIGVAAAFSFYPGKNLGACGDAGAITTNSDEISKTVRMLRDHGSMKKYYHHIEGYNGRLDSIQAAFLRIKLKRLPRWTELRREAAARYRKLFDGTEFGSALPFEPEWSKAVYHLFIVRVNNRDEFMRHLGAANIGTGIHYPIPLHLQDAYQKLGYRAGDFPVTERVSPEIVSLPMCPYLRADQQSRIAEETLNYVTANSAAVAD